MKTKAAIFSLFIVILMTGGCIIGPFNTDAKFITPSGVSITEERSVSGFTGIDVRTFGKVLLSQGASESVTVKGSDNIVPLIQTSVRDGVLVIETSENYNITGLNDANMLTFTIVVQDLSSLTVSGAAEVTMDSLATSSLAITMSGAGSFELGDLQAQSANITISGVGNVDLAGEAAEARIDISGAGPVNAGDLKTATANVTISGVGSATVWVTDLLSGNISGAGNVSYYGDPRTDTQTSGIGDFNSLGNK